MSEGPNEAVTGMELVKVEDHAVQRMDYHAAEQAAHVCRKIVEETAVQISGKRYVRVEGWQAIAVAHGCVASARDVERVEGGIRAIGEVRRGIDGAVIATAEGFLGDDESTWSKRAEYAKRAMAQTRAISRACRSAFAHVVVLMAAGLETTPAEEVPSEGFADHKPAPKAKPAPKPKAAGPTLYDQTGSRSITALIDKVREKSGDGAKGPWTRFYFQNGKKGEYFSTFDSNLGAALRNLEGGYAVITYKLIDGPKGKYNTIESVEPAGDAAEPAATEPETSEELPL